MRSLRSRLLAGTGLGAVLVLAAAGLAVYVLVRARLVAEFDHALADKARSLAILVEQEGDEVEVEFAEHPLREFQAGVRPEYYQLWLLDGTVLARSPSLGHGNLDRIAGPAHSPACRWVVLPDGRRGRTAGILFHPVGEGRRSSRSAASSDPPLTLVVARDTSQVEGTLGHLRLFLGGVGAAAVVLSLAVLAWVVRSGLRPVSHLAAQIGGLDEGDLGARLDVPDAPAELAPVVERLNDLLGRLERAFAQQKALTADVAHELRTPLAGLQATLEVALSRDRDTDAYRAAMSDCLAICRQTERMVDSLLCLARIDAGEATVHAESVRLHDLLRECWRALADRARGRALQVEWNVDPELALHSDRDKLRLILSNVLDNAVSYADAGGRIWIQAASPDGRIQISVANTGSHLSQDEAERVFERFWRGDEARAATGVHCGLGLSLCKQLVDLLGGSIHVQSAAGDTFRVVLDLNPGTDGRETKTEEREDLSHVVEAGRAERS
jgi:heavy metal sensor kinase